MFLPRSCAEGGPVQLLADDFFFVAHDSLSTKLRLSDRLVRLGLAGALLGELVLYRRITIRGGQLRVVNSTAPRDALAHTVLHHLVAESDVTLVRDWLRFFSRTSYEQVAQRLARESLLTVREERRLLRSTVVYKYTDNIRAAWPESRLARRLTDGVALEPPDIVLAGLVGATGLDAYVLKHMPSHARQYLHRSQTVLPTSLREVIDETAAAIGDAVLSSRA